MQEVHMTDTTNNPAVPSASQEVYSPDQLIAGRFPLVTGQSITLMHSAALKRGTVLGQITKGTATAAAVTGNTGGGALTVAPTTPVLANAQPGVYAVECITAVTAGGIFRVTDPKGDVLGDVAIGATFADQIKFAIADGTPDFVVGDSFLVTVAAGSRKYLKSVTTAVDGSEAPSAILADDADASDADVLCAVYLTGEFNANKLIMDASWTAATLTPVLRPLGLHVRDAVSAADPS
jgi:hypothetical protein